MGSRLTTLPPELVARLAELDPAADHHGEPQAAAETSRVAVSPTRSGRTASLRRPQRIAAVIAGVAATAAVATAGVVAMRPGAPPTTSLPRTSSTTASTEAAVRAAWGLRSDAAWIGHVDALRPRLIRLNIPVTATEAANLDRRGELNAPANAVEALAQRQFPERFAGTWLDQATPNGAVVLALTGPAPDATALGKLRQLVPSWAGFRIVANCRYTKAALDALATRITDDIPGWWAEGIRVNGDGTDVAKNRVEVSVDPQAPANAEAILAARYGDAIVVVRRAPGRL